MLAIVLFVIGIVVSISALLVYRKNFIGDCKSPFYFQNNSIPCGLYQTYTDKMEAVNIVVKITKVVTESDRYTIYFNTQHRNKILARKMIIPKVNKNKYMVWQVDSDIANEKSWQRIYDTPDKIVPLLKANQYAMVVFVRYTEDMISSIKSKRPDLTKFISCMKLNNNFINELTNKNTDMGSSIVNGECGVTPTQFYVLK